MRPLLQSWANWGQTMRSQNHEQTIYGHKFIPNGSLSPSVELDFIFASIEGQASNIDVDVMRLLC